MKFTKQQIKIARRFLRKNGYKLLMARDTENKTRFQSYLLKREEWAIKILADVAQR
jgi:hypothetical protein